MKSSPIRDVLWLSNEARLQQGLKPVVWHPLLQRCAEGYAQQLAEADVLDHELQGISLGQRVLKVGYVYHMSAENLAAGQAKPEDVVYSWLNSPSHCENLLNVVFCHIGLGYVCHPSSKYRHFWVQVLAVPW